MYSSVGAIRNRPVRTNWQVRSGTQPRGLCHCLDPWLPSRLCMMQAVSTWNRLDLDGADYLILTKVIEAVEGKLELPEEG